MSLEVELFHFLAVVHGFGVDFGISEDYTLPNGFVRLLKSYVEELVVFNSPESFFNLYFLAELAVNERFGLSFNQYLEVLALHVNDELLCCGAFGQFNLHFNVLNAL